MRRTIAVVGGGLFGTTIARQLAEAGFAVDLLERHSDIMMGATLANQGRLHHGYHYPRSPSLKLREHAQAFAAEYPSHVTRDAEHYYCIARDGSHLAGAQYLDVCASLGLPHEPARPAAVKTDAVDVCVRVPEALIDVVGLRTHLRAELDRLGVRIVLNHEVDSRSLTGYHWVVNATYGRGFGRPLRWEVCEIVVLEAGPAVQGTSVVVMDGPFVSLDPVPGGRYHLLYDVVHSVHAFNVGEAPMIPDHLAPLLDRGLVTTPHSNIEAMLATARRFLNGLETPRHLGSRFTVRAVLPNVDATDERPTLIEQDGRHLSVLPGKLDMSVWAARHVLEITGQDAAVSPLAG